MFKQQPVSSSPNRPIPAIKGDFLSADSLSAGISMFKQQLVYSSPNRPIRAIKGDYLAKGLLFPMHFHTEIELIHVLAGELKLRCDNSEFTVKQGETVFINGNVPHSTEMMQENTCSARLQFVDPTTFSGSIYYLSKFLKQFDKPVYVFQHGDSDTQKLTDYISESLAAADLPDTSGDCMLTGYMYMVTALLYKKGLLASKEQITDNKTIEKLLPVLEYIDKNFDEHITLDTLCSILNLNKQYFCRIFKKATGSTVIDYLNFVRTCKAEVFLKTNMNVSEVAYKAGFASPSYFNKIFKRYMMCTPLTYKRIYHHTDDL